MIISGPCSAETAEQVIQTAIQLKEIDKVDVLRAGIWKPRTRPNMFEGVGSIGLPWLLEAKKITGLPTAIEIANAKQVEEALRHEVDILWIGARTTGNPFSVQEIADVLKGVDIPVLIKNPLHPDLELWIGALERIQKTGVKHVGLIHRGFATYGDSDYRNPPMWHVAIEMKRINPGILFLNDPSHICGRRDTLLKVAQCAIDLAYDGLMIESHLQPDLAWSDAKQQVTPSQLDTLLNSIHWRRNITENDFIHAELDNMRLQINQLDEALIQLLAQRMKIADCIGDFKRENNVAILQTDRWNEILERATKQGVALGLSPEFVVNYVNAVHMESIQHQNKVMNRTTNPVELAK